MASQRVVEAPVMISRANSAATIATVVEENLRRTLNEMIDLQEVIERR
jgi:hypothetical protein